MPDDTPLPYDAYLFDADGTLFDTRELIYRSYRAMFEALGRAPPERDAVERGTGQPFPEQARQLLGPVSREVFAAAMEIYRRRQGELVRNSLRLFPGTREGLIELRRRGARLAVVTSRSGPSIRSFLEDSGLTRLFDAVISPEDTERHKPAPDPVWAALERLGTPPDRAVMIGDAVFDIESGWRAGTATVLVAWGGMDAAEFPIQPDYVVHSFDELPRLRRASPPARECL